VCLFRPSLSFLAEAQPRLDIGEETRHFLAKVHINSFRRLQSKTYHRNNYKFILYLPFSNR
jgi:hypothetical protein